MIARRRLLGILLLVAIAAWNAPVLARAAGALEPWRKVTAEVNAGLTRGVLGSWTLEELEGVRMGDAPRVRAVDAFAGGVLITDSDRKLIVERLVDGTTRRWSVPVPADNQQYDPWCAQRLSDGDFLLTMRNHDEILQMDRDTGATTRVYGTGEDTHEGLGVMDAFSAERLGDAPDGRILLGESVKGPRVAEVKSGVGVVWQLSYPVYKAKMSHWVNGGAEVMVVDAGPDEGPAAPGEESSASVTIYDRATSKPVWKFTNKDAAALANPAFAPVAGCWTKGPDDREQVIVGDDYDGTGPKGRVLVIDRATKQVVEQIEVPPPARMNANPRGVDISPDGIIYVGDDAGPRVFAYGYPFSAETPVSTANIGSAFEDKKVHSISWDAETPYGTKVELFYRFSDSPGTQWQSAGTSGSFTFPDGTLVPMLQYYARFTTPDARIAPLLKNVTVEWLPRDVTPAPDTPDSQDETPTPNPSGNATGTKDSTSTGSVRLQLGKGAGGGSGKGKGPGNGKGAGGGTGGAGAGASGGTSGGAGGTGPGTGLLFKPVKDEKPRTPAAIPPPDPGSQKTAASLLGTLYAIGLVVRPRPWFVPI